MRTTLFVLAWAFVLGVAAYDAHFAWRYRSAFDAWELNPLARRVAGACGLLAVLGLKAGLLAFAALVGLYCHLCRHRLAVPYTLTVSGVHLALSLHYLLGGLC
jgi:hypothetical protein